jgi:predicted nucleic acid-binding protein
MFLLDTNVISELRHGKAAPSATVRAWAKAQPIHVLYLSAVTQLELEIGVLRMARRDPPQADVLRIWLFGVLAQFDGRILPFSSLTAPHCAPLHVPDQRSFRDSMIAATALEHGFTVVTRNEKDFEGCAVALLNPWTDQTNRRASPSL